MPGRVRDLPSALPGVTARARRVQRGPCPRPRPAAAASRPRIAVLSTIAILGVLAPVTAARGQPVDPGGRWQTIRTPHFDVHFTPVLEEAARRAAADAEVAYAALAAHLSPPRGRVDLVVADNVDYTNGFTTPVPSNRVVIYTNPPLDVPSLRFYDDWLALVITHELTHVFHLDRVGGWWHAAQRVFGRAAWLFPNLYDPAWITEGLATYYESALTGAGRVQGTFERMVVEASVLEAREPRIDELSLATSRFPGGEMAYAYGALFFDYLAAVRGPEAVRRFVERSAREPVPFRLNDLAVHTFGLSFTRAWAEWVDSLRRATADRPASPLPGWHDLTREGRTAEYPRWVDDSSLVFVAATGKESPAAYRIDTAGHAHRLGRRNSIDANAPGADGTVVFAQLEYLDPYHIRSDLYVQRGTGRRRVRRVTNGARLIGPDVRADGWMVAVQLAPGTNRLVRVSPDGRAILPVTHATLDTQWAEPRWSPRGDRIAVTRWMRGGYADIVVLDTLGRLLATTARERAVDSSPSWTPDGTGVLFTSDRTGIADVYLARFDTTGARDEPVPVWRLTRAATGLFYPVASPDGRTLAAARFRSDGWHIGAAPLDLAAAEPGRLDAAPVDGSTVSPARLDTSRVRPYSSWSSLLPRAWTPLIGETATGHAAVGALVQGVDVIGRHAYTVQALLDPRGEAHDWWVTYRYAGLRQPVVGVSTTQEWTSTSFLDSAGRPGVLRRRARIGGLTLTVSRPRLRTTAFASVGGEIEARDYRTEPAPLLTALDPFFRSKPVYRSLVASAGWANVQRPPLSISPEDGVAVSTTAQWRWLRGEGEFPSRAITGVASGYQSIDAGGFAHHVLAARIAVGDATGPATDEFTIGGTGGNTTTILPGLALAQLQTFGVRAFPPGARSGRRALASTLEYRAPLLQLLRGLGSLPVYLDRASLAAFADAGAADDGPILGHLDPQAWIASVGAELDLDAAFQYDLPARIRCGVAFPVIDRGLRPTGAPSVYLRLGAAF